MKITFAAVLLGSSLLTAKAAVAATYQSHPPLRPLPPVSQRPLTPGPSRYVDATGGKDANDGSKAKPWRTLNHAMIQLSAGETLYLRGGVYRENVYCGVNGHPDAPITIRSYPGERAILDGGFAEFTETPAKAWVPLKDGEYRSTKAYKNIRDVLGMFADSHIGLQTYWHPEDMRSTNEFMIDDPEKKFMVKPVYCGPGLWYDRDTGYIHIRLAHTHGQNPEVPNYSGETDPRKMPLVIAPFNSVTLFVDLAKHVRFQDLVIRGGGYNNTVLQFGIDLEFDNVLIYGGTYCMRARNTGPLKFTNSALYGHIPPWGWRGENSLATYTPRAYDPYLITEDTKNTRNIARLPTHALLVTEGFHEEDTFAYPFNHDWEISNSEFADSHDAVALTGRNMRFHHNWVGDIQDDALYLSNPTNYVNDNCYYYQNLITRCTSAFACHTRGGPGGNIYIFRNIVDQRKGVLWENPSPAKPKGVLLSHNLFLMHGGEVLGIESLFFYQNTFTLLGGNQRYAGLTLYRTSPVSQRRVFNNIFLYRDDYGTFVADDRKDDIQTDGNLYWCPVPGATAPADYLEKMRTSANSIANQKNLPDGWEAHSLVADPKLEAFSLDVNTLNNYGLRKDSPAIGKGVLLPKEWEDPLRPKNGSAPDIGALPVGAEPLRVGINRRISAGESVPEMK